MNDSEIGRSARKLAAIIEIEAACETLSAMNAGKECNEGLLEQTMAECQQQRDTLHALIAAQEPVTRTDILVLALLLHGHVQFMHALETLPTNEAKTQMLALCERLVRGIETVCQVTAAELGLTGYDVSRRKRRAVRLASAIAGPRIQTRPSKSCNI